MAGQSETQRQIERKRAEDKAAMDRQAKDLAEQRQRDSEEEWKN